MLKLALPMPTTTRPVKYPRERQETPKQPWCHRHSRKRVPTTDVAVIVGSTHFVRRDRVVASALPRDPTPEPGHAFMHSEATVARQN
jgi:hypothetical protein